MQHVEREHSNGAEHRDTVVRTVIFAFVSLAAWWCCSNVASADDAQSADRATTDTPSGPSSEAAVNPAGPVLPAWLTGATPVPSDRAAATDVEDPGEVVTDEPAAVVVSDPPEAFAPAPPATPEPVLMPAVVVPLVNAVSPALAPVGEVVYPVLDAVTTPVAPLVQTVVPVVDQIAGPVLGPVAAPLVAALAPAIEQASSAAAPVVALVAPAVVPVAKPVVALVAPAIGQVTRALADPLVAVVRPAVRSVLDLESRYLGLRPTTAGFTGESRGASTAQPMAIGSTGDTLAGADVAGAGAPVHRIVDASGDRRGARWAEAELAGGAVLGAAAPAAPASPSGVPFRPAAPAPGAVVMAHGGSDTSERSQRLVAVLSPAAGVPSGQLSALSRTPVVSALARFGGRPPVTPD